MRRAETLARTPAVKDVENEVSRFQSKKGLRALVALVASALPGNQVPDGRAAGAGSGMFVRLDFFSRGFLTHGLDAQPDFFLFGIHLYDLEVVLLPGFERHRLPVGIDRF